MSDEFQTDREWLAAIADERDPARLVGMIHQFYYNKDRAERQPRAVLYLHLGLLSGTIMRQLAPTSLAEQLNGLDAMRRAARTAGLDGGDPEES